MRPKPILYLCMGSACHQLGGFRLIPRLEGLLQRHGLADRVELKGAFCLEVCERGRSVRVGGQVLTGLTPENLEERFLSEILPRIRATD